MICLGGNRAALRRIPTEKQVKTWYCVLFFIDFSKLS